MVLAVHVRRDRPADRDLPGAGQDRHPESQGQQGAHQGVQADPCLDGHRRRLGLGVDVQDAVQLGQVERRAARILRSVAVTPAQPSRDDAAPAVGLAQDGDRIGHRVDVGQMRPRRGGATPPVQRHHWLRLRYRGFDRGYLLLVPLAAHQNTATKITTSHTNPIPCKTRSCRTTSSGSPALPESTSRAYCSNPSVKGAIETAVQGTPSGGWPSRFSNAHKLYEINTITAAS